MQFKIFNVPIGDAGQALQELNAFLRGNKVLEVDHHLIHNERGAYWSFCVRYLEKHTAEMKPETGSKKIDYRKLLDELVFKKFSRLREIRKEVAAEEGVSAFVVFTDAELAELAKLDELTPKGMLSIKGIGEKKVERYASIFMSKLKQNETEGTLD